MTMRKRERERESKEKGFFLPDLQPCCVAVNLRINTMMISSLLVTYPRFCHAPFSSCHEIQNPKK